MSSYQTSAQGGGQTSGKRLCVVFSFNFLKINVDFHLDFYGNKKWVLHTTSPQKQKKKVDKNHRSGTQKS